MTATLAPQSARSGATRNRASDTTGLGWQDTSVLAATGRETTRSWEEPRADRPLPAPYLQVRDRLSRFADVPYATVDRAWRLLRRWRAMCLDAGGGDLPAPWVFADDFGRVVFEWDASNGSVTVRVPQTGRVFLDVEVLGTDAETLLVDAETVTVSLLPVLNQR